MATRTLAQILAAATAAGAFAKKTELNDEAAARQAADSNILSNTDPQALDSLSEVVTAFEAADANLNNAITTLAGNSSTAVQAVQNDLNAYKTSNDTALQAAVTDLASEVTNRTNAVQAVADDLSAEVTRATGIESGLRTDVNMLHEIADKETPQ